MWKNLQSSKYEFEFWCNTGNKVVRYLSLKKTPWNKLIDVTPASNMKTIRKTHIICAMLPYRHILCQTLEFFFGLYIPCSIVLRVGSLFTCWTSAYRKISISSKMRLLNLFFYLALGEKFNQRRRFIGFHANKRLGSATQNNDESGMSGNQGHNCIHFGQNCDPKLQSLIDSMITDRRKISIQDFTAWKLYKKNLNS